MKEIAIILIEKLFSQIPGISITAVLFIFGIAYVYHHPQKFEYWENKLKQWWSSLAWLLSRISDKFEYTAITSGVEGDTNSFVAKLEDKTAMQLPRISVRLAGSKAKEGLEWEEDEAILIMRDRHGKTKNSVHAAYLFTSETVLRRAKRHLSKTQKTSTDLHVTQRILENTNRATVEHFISEYVIPKIEGNDDVRKFLQQYEYIEKKGLFFPVLLQELTYLGNKIFYDRPSDEIRKEIRGLIDFLEGHANRPDGDNIPKTFLGKHLRCAIHIIAATQTMLRGDISGHRKVIRKLIEKEPENIYLLGSASLQNRLFMHRAARAVMQDFPLLEKKKTHKFAGRIKTHGKFKDVDTYMIHLHNPSAIRYSYTADDLEN